MRNLPGFGKISGMTNDPDRYPPTVKALLEKRGLLLQTIEANYAAIAGLRNDVAAVNRVLETFGYDEDLDKFAPKLRTIFFEKGQLARILADELRNGARPDEDLRFGHDSHGKARARIPAIGSCSRKSHHRTTNALRRMRVVGLVEAEKGPRGTLVWSRTSKHRT